MRNSIVILFLCFLCPSCFLFSKYKKINFTYTEGGKAFSMPVIVPKGYSREKTEVDSSGNTILSYAYAGKAMFYIAYLVDTTVQVQPIDEKVNMPLVNRAGARFFKGMDDEHLFWREIRRNALHVGYRYVPPLLESRFDSASNYVAKPRRK